MKKVLVISGIVWLLIESWILFFISPSPAYIPASLMLRWTIIAGGPLFLISVLILAIQKEKVAGSIALLGAAVAGLGFGVGSGANLGHYFEGFLLFVVPQALLGILLMKIGRDRERRENSPVVLNPIAFHVPRTVWLKTSQADYQPSTYSQSILTIII